METTEKTTEQLLKEVEQLEKEKSNYYTWYMDEVKKNTDLKRLLKCVTELIELNNK